MVGMPIDQVRLICVFLVNYPLGWLQFYCVPHGSIRHLFNISVGLFLQYFMFRQAIYHVVLITSVTYLLMALLPRNKQQNYVMAWVMGYLSYIHLERMWTNYGSYDLEISLYLML